MNFGKPDILLHLVWLTPVSAFFFVYAFRKETNAMNAFAERKLIPDIVPGYSSKYSALRMAFVFMSAVFLMLAMARPQWGFHWKEVKNEGIDMVFALDTSRSMLAEDFSPNRLTFAKNEIRKFVESLKGGRVSLIAFSGEAFLQCPLTIDHPSFLLMLDFISSAVDLAVKSFEEGTFGTNRLLILISDGEDHLGDTEGAFERARGAGVTICSIGIGSDEGAPIPFFDPVTGRTEFLTDDSGKTVLTALNESALRSAADKTGGVYVRAEKSRLGLEVIKKDKLSVLEPQETEVKKVKVFNQRYRYPLGAAVIFLFLDLFIRGNHSREKKR